MIPALPTARVGKRILLYTCLARKACSPSASAPQPTSARPVLARSLEVASIRAAANPPAVPLPVSDEGGHRGEACTWGPKCGPRGRSHVGRHLPNQRGPVSAHVSRPSPIGSGRGSRKPGNGRSGHARTRGRASMRGWTSRASTVPPDRKRQGSRARTWKRGSRVRARARIRAREDEAFSPASAFSGLVAPARCLPWPTSRRCSPDKTWSQPAVVSP